MSSVFHGKRVDWISFCRKTLENSTCSNIQSGVCVIGTFSTNRIWNVGETYHKQRTQHQLRERTTNPIVALSKRIDWAMSRLPSKELSAVLSKMNTTSEYLPDFAMKLSFPEAKQCAASKPHLTWQYWGLGGSNADIAEHLLIVHWSLSGVTPVGSKLPNAKPIWPWVVKTQKKASRMKTPARERRYTLSREQEKQSRRKI